MFHSSQLNNRINKIHERALRLVYKDNKLTFNGLLELDNSVTIHQRNLQIFATEIFKVKNSLAPEIMTEVFEINEPHNNLRFEASHFKTENVKSTHYRRVAESFSGRVRFSKFRAGLPKYYMLNLISNLFKVPSYEYMCK